LQASSGLAQCFCGPAAIADPGQARRALLSSKIEPCVLASLLIDDIAVAS
jgi:hypothetical protein